MKKLISILGMIVVLTMLLSAAGPSGWTTWAGGLLPPAPMPKVTKPVTVTWLGHAAFKLESEGKIIFIDPFITGNPTCPIEVGNITAADLILLTHDHGDHVGDTIAIANKFGAPVVAMPETLARLEGAKPRLDPACNRKRNIGGASEVDGISVIMTEAIHSSGTASPAGYIIKFPGGATIYHAGDTGIFANMQVYGALYPMHIALLPIGGHYTMDAMEAANSLILLKPAIAIPMHFATFPVLAPDAGEFVELAKKVAPEVDVIVLEPGDSYTLQPGTY